MDWFDPKKIERFRHLLERLFKTSNSGIKEHELLSIWDDCKAQQLICELRFGVYSDLVHVHIDRFGRRFYTYKYKRVFNYSFFIKKKKQLYLHIASTGVYVLYICMGGEKKKGEQRSIFSNNLSLFDESDIKELDSYFGKMDEQNSASICEFNVRKESEIMLSLNLAMERSEEVASVTDVRTKIVVELDKTSLYYDDVEVESPTKITKEYATAKNDQLIISSPKNEKQHQEVNGEMLLPSKVPMIVQPNKFMSPGKHLLATKAAKTPHKTVTKSLVASVNMDMKTVSSDSLVSNKRHAQQEMDKSHCYQADLSQKEKEIFAGSESIKQFNSQDESNEKSAITTKSTNENTRQVLSLSMDEDDEDTMSTYGVQANLQLLHSFVFFFCLFQCLYLSRVYYNDKKKKNCTENPPRRDLNLCGCKIHIQINKQNKDTDGEMHSFFACANKHNGRKYKRVETKCKSDNTLKTNENVDSNRKTFDKKKNTMTSADKKQVRSSKKRNDSMDSSERKARNELMLYVETKQSGEFGFDWNQAKWQSDKKDSKSNQQDTLNSSCRKDRQDWTPSSGVSPSLEWCSSIGFTSTMEPQTRKSIDIASLSFTPASTHTLQHITFDAMEDEELELSIESTKTVLRSAIASPSPSLFRFKTY
ncbi:hypothetical protein RFI_01009 [Reticulomyxa filosa]|uniref:Uncharacterized protein n=1 Tax=Reticulomyxa filosa TaxID=46433 RepID=X6PC13_RETFI|nr:hypothetical protein RFI_01009 [Reticulomyxa filosa]|eukprot:ETO36050.1 hypothetical protein RFI_01009 [Reticulomyxa filosa]